MWSVVDYSTMSNEFISEAQGVNQADFRDWPESWFGLFGTIDDQGELAFGMQA